MSVSFTVFEAPRGAMRHRAGRRGSRIAMYHDPKHTSAEGRIAHAAREAVGPTWEALAVPVRVTLETFHARPQALAKARKWWPSPEVPFKGKPDADNVAKLVMDALTKAGVWTDDTVVADLVVRRRYVAVRTDGVQDEPRTIVHVEVL